MSKLIQSRPALAIAAAGAALAGSLAVAGTASAVSHPGAAHLAVRAKLAGPDRPGHAVGLGVGKRRGLSTTTFYNWPMFRAGATHYGVSPETAISTVSAPSLASAWAAKLGSISYTSPAVVTVGSLGKALVYAGADNHMYAYPASGGAPVWTYTIASGVVETSPAVYSGVVDFGSTAGTLYAVNAATGALECSFSTTAPILASPVVASAPDGSGPVVYDGTVPGNGAASGAEWAIYGPGNKHGGCTQDWEFTGFQVSPGGSWSPPAYGTDAAGVPLLVFGSKDDDDSVYALNASTGALVWRYQTTTAEFHDVGSPPVISPPGRNGFADGVVYVVGKDKSVYAIDLTTGALIWKYALASGTHGDVAGAALVNNRIYLGSDTGVYALNAVTGALVWHVLSSATFYASPAVTGPGGQQVLLIGDTTSTLYALNLATGATVWSHAFSTGFFASPAVSQGAFYVTGLDGMLRSYAPGA
jgi:eukaryotic-like serine/threonine-protein kinase